MKSWNKQITDACEALLKEYREKVEPEATNDWMNATEELIAVLIEYVVNLRSRVAFTQQRFAGYTQFHAAWVDLCAETFSEMQFQNEAILELLSDVGYKEQVKKLEALFENHNKLHRNALQQMVEASLEAQVKKDGKILSQHEIYKLWQDLEQKRKDEAEASAIDENGVSGPEKEDDS
jgi:hypothetical protein